MNTSNRHHQSDNQPNLSKSRLMRGLFFVLGVFFVALGIVGIVLPVLPTTPFILLAAGCFAKSSARFHAYLINHKTFGTLIANWHERRAIPKHAKWFAWTMMTASCLMLFWRFWDKPKLLWIAAVCSLICFATIIWMSRLPDD